MESKKKFWFFSGKQEIKLGLVIWYQLESVFDGLLPNMTLGFKLA